MQMLGTIIGDVVGSIYEWDNIKTKDFPLFTKKNFFTDDTVITLAVAKALLNLNQDLKAWQTYLIQEMQRIGLQYPHSGYGGHFRLWLRSKHPKPYNSYGNGAGMRISPVAYVANSVEEVKFLSHLITEVTHNHPEGIKAAEAIAIATYLAKTNHSKKDIKTYIQKHYYPLKFTLDEIRPTYQFDVTAQGSTPQAIVAFLESEDFEDAIRNAISIGGDSDTVAAMTGSIAEAFYGVPQSLKTEVLGYLTEDLKAIINLFTQQYKI